MCESGRLVGMTFPNYNVTSIQYNGTAVCEYSLAGTLTRPTQ